MGGGSEKPGAAAAAEGAGGGQGSRGGGSRALLTTPARERQGTLGSACVVFCACPKSYQYSMISARHREQGAVEREALLGCPRPQGEAGAQFLSPFAAFPAQLLPPLLGGIDGAAGSRSPVEEGRPLLGRR